MKIISYLIICLIPLTIYGENRKENRPNILFVFSDDHAPHAIGSYNGWLKEINPTPAIDKLAESGMIFVNSFCTNSICGPSRAVIQTGKHSHKNGFMNTAMHLIGINKPFLNFYKRLATKLQSMGKVTLRDNL